MTRRLAIWLATLLAFVAMIAGAASSAGDVSETPTTIEWGGRTYDGKRIFKGDRAGTSVAIVPVTGTIASGDSDPSGAVTGSEDLVSTIRAIRESGDFDAILLEVDTPGGGVLASAEVAEEVREARRKDDLVVVAWMRDIAASGGYYISSQADHIIAAPTTMTGSIGVIMQLMQFDGLADEVGIEAVTIKSGRLKDMGSPFRDMTAEERDVLQRMIDEAYGDFLDTVSDGRGMTLGDVRELADGRIYTGRQAAKLGLVDSLGTRFDAYDTVARLVHKGDDAQDVSVTRFERRYGFYDIFGASSAATALGGRASGAGALVDALALLFGDRASTGGMRAGSGAGAAPAADAAVRNGLPVLEYRAVL